MSRFIYIGKLIAVFLIFSVSGVHAFDEIIEYDITPYVQTAGGEPKACGIEFGIAFKDKVNRGGDISFVTGSLSFMKINSTFRTVLKIGGADPDGRGNFLPYQPAEVSFNSRKVSTVRNITKMNRFQCENSNGFCATLNEGDSILITGATFENDLSIIFNRSPGAIDSELPIILDIGLERHPDKRKSFGHCYKHMLIKARETWMSTNGYSQYLK